MLPLDEMMLKAQNGAAIDMVSRQFDLTRDQTVAAMEALLPAFSQGLKRTAATPEGVAPFLQALASGNHAKYMEDMSRAFSPGGLADGNGILGHLFGSKEVSRAVADHAARATGIGQDVLKQMLPAIASMLMGGLFQQSTGGMNAASGRGFGAGGNIIGEVIEQMMRQGQAMGGTQQRSEHRDRQPQTDSRESGAEAPPSPFDNPFGRIFEDMLAGGMGMSPGGDRGKAPEPERSSSKPQSKNPYEDLFGQMFETGRKAQEDYQRGVESIFDQFLQGMNRHR